MFRGEKYLRVVFKGIETGNTSTVEVHRRITPKRLVFGIGRREIKDLTKAHGDEPAEVIEALVVKKTPKRVDSVTRRLKPLGRESIEHRVLQRQKKQYRRVFRRERNELHSDMLKVHKTAMKLERTHHKTLVEAKAQPKISEGRKRWMMRLMHPLGSKANAEVSRFKRNPDYHVYRLLSDAAQGNLYPDQTPDQKPRDLVNWLMALPRIGTFADDLIALANIFVGHGSGRGKAVQLGFALGTDVIQDVTIPKTIGWLKKLPGIGNKAFEAADYAGGLVVAKTLGPIETHGAIQRVDDEMNIQSILGLTKFLQRAKRTQLQNVLAAKVVREMNVKKQGGSILEVAKDRLANAAQKTTEGTVGNKAQWKVAQDYAEMYMTLYSVANAIANLSSQASAHETFTSHETH